MQDYTAVQYARSALLLIDVQADFGSGPAAVEGTREIIPRLAALSKAFRAAGRPIFHAIRFYRPGGSDVDPDRRALIEQGTRIAAPGSAGADIPPSLTAAPAALDHERLLAGELQSIGDADFVLFKPRWSAFHRTALDDRLRAMGVTSLVVGGCNLPNCPRATLFDATERDYRAAIAVTSRTRHATPDQ